MAYKRIRPIPVNEGGTGALTLTGVLTGNGTSAITANAVTQNGILYGAASNAVSSLAVAATGSTLMGNTGSAPSFTGSPSFSGSVTAGTTITASSGNITATSGNLVLTAATSSTIGQLVQGSVPIFHTFGGDNIFIGTPAAQAGNFTLSGSFNTCIGRAVGAGITSGQQNVAMGWVALNSCTQGSFNVGIGLSALQSLTTGNYNCAVGFQAGNGLTVANSSNILINNNGVAGDNNTMRLAAGTGTGNQQVNKTFIHGIRGITTVNADAIAVLVDSAGQLGTVSSSIRYKQNVQDLPDTRVLELRPVLFEYKKDGRQATGLIAEEVFQIMPELVATNQDNQIESVKYHDLPVLLLAEIKKLSNRVAQLEEKLNG